MGQGVQTLAIPEGGDLPNTIASANRALQALGVAMLQVQGAFNAGGGPSTGPYSVYPLAANSVGSTQIDAGAVINSKLAANAVQTANILAGAVTTLKIANAAVTFAQVAVNTLTGGLTGNLAVGTITNDNLVSNTIQANSIAAATILGTNIAASTITGGNIAAATITAGLLNVLTLSAITANMGAITAGTIVMSTTGFIRGGQTAYNTGTGWWLGYDSTDYKFSIGSTTNSLTWDGSTMTMVGGTSAIPVIIQSTGFRVGPVAGTQISIGNQHTSPISIMYGTSNTTFQMTQGLDSSNQPYLTMGTTNVVSYQVINGHGAGNIFVTPNAGMLELQAITTGSAWTLSLRTLRSNSASTGILIANDFWNFGFGMAGIIAEDSTSSGGNLVLQTTRNGGGASGTPVASVRILNDATVQIINNSGTPGTPAGSGYLYVNSGALLYKGSSGTVTTIASA